MSSRSFNSSAWILSPSQSDPILPGQGVPSVHQKPRLPQHLQNITLISVLDPLAPAACGPGWNVLLLLALLALTLPRSSSAATCETHPTLQFLVAQLSGSHRWTLKHLTPHDQVSQLISEGSNCGRYIVTVPRVLPVWNCECFNGNT